MYRKKGGEIKQARRSLGKNDGRVGICTRTAGWLSPSIPSDAGSYHHVNTLISGDLILAAKPVGLPRKTASSSSGSPAKALQKKLYKN